MFNYTFAAVCYTCKEFRIIPGIIVQYPDLCMMNMPDHPSGHLLSYISFHPKDTEAVMAEFQEETFPEPPAHLQPSKAKRLNPESGMHSSVLKTRDNTCTTENPARDRDSTSQVP